MKILAIEVTGLSNRPDPVDLRFNEDLSIVTGRNGAGKTTILKLLWYVISGNIHHALREIPFKTTTVTTSSYKCSITRRSRFESRIHLTVGNEKYDYETEADEDDAELFQNAEELANSRLVLEGGSLFFPTFRRIEGGFSLEEPSRVPTMGRTSRRSDVEEALLVLSRRLTNGGHRFVSAISTSDIVRLLLQRYAELSEESNRLQQATSQEIIESIKTYKYDKTDILTVGQANDVIDKIKNKVEEMERQRQIILVPIDTVRHLVEQLFCHSGINIGTRLSFGDAASAIDSGHLSAGEKQMLSFICYNTFFQDSIIFIDEPELSLHVDWQRQLFTILQKQNTSNQFIIATHSPFIYSRYPDKEVNLVADRGDCEE